MTDQQDTPEIRRTRSPGYPFIDLETAVEQTIKLHALAPKNDIPLDAAVEVWGFSIKSSNNFKTAAALKRYGMIDDVGDGQMRRLRLTDFGRRVVFHARDRSSSEWSDLMQAAALRPEAFRQVLDHFDGVLPADRVAEHWLIFDNGYNEDAAREMLRRLKKTLSFAGLTGKRIVGGQVQEAGDGDPSGGTEIEERSLEAQQARGGADAARSGAQVRMQAPIHAYGGSHAELIGGPSGQPPVSIPYAPGRWATLAADFPITEREWDAMMTMIAAMKPGLVEDRTYGVPSAGSNPVAAARGTDEFE